MITFGPDHLLQIIEKKVGRFYNSLFRKSYDSFFKVFRFILYYVIFLQKA